MNCSNTTPRKLLPTDAAAYFAFRRKSLIESPWAFKSSPDDDRVDSIAAVEKFLADEENDVLVITEDGDSGKLLAAAGVVRQKRLKVRHRASIWGVYCDPVARGRGYGRAVIKAAVETARSWDGVEIVSLSVTTKEKVALGIYESLGFKQWGLESATIRIHGQTYDEIHLHLHL